MFKNYYNVIYIHLLHSCASNYYIHPIYPSSFDHIHVHDPIHDMKKKSEFHVYSRITLWKWWRHDYHEKSWNIGACWGGTKKLSWLLWCESPIKPSGVLNSCLHVSNYSCPSKPTILLWREEMDAMLLGLMPFFEGHLINLLLINTTHNCNDHVFYSFPWGNIYIVFVEEVFEWVH